MAAAHRVRMLLHLNHDSTQALPGHVLSSNPCSAMATMAHNCCCLDLYCIWCCLLLLCNFPMWLGGQYRCVHHANDIGTMCIETSRHGYELHVLASRDYLRLDMWTCAYLLAERQQHATEDEDCRLLFVGVCIHVSNGSSALNIIQAQF